MTKRDLVIRIATETGISQREVNEVVQRTFDHILNELASGRGVELRNFGVFMLSQRKGRLGRNPQKPKSTVEIPGRTIVKFKPGKNMREKVAKLD